MKTWKNEISPILLYFVSIFALILYLHGFFPIENSLQSDEFKPQKRYNVGNSRKLFHKLVLIVIDALRFDFVFPEKSENYMSFTTTSILRNESCLIKLRAQAPTVTMPRIKAITSGTVPTYFDIVTNFMSSEFKLDNFLHQATQNNFKIVFYGDDTWIKLFPNSFVRSEGTNSFFASDYTEVDDNVTRHLDEEFSRKDWDFLILHYLGLDHIGHMEGPKSVLIKPKLKEMDAIILKIFHYLQEMEEGGVKSLFMVTSDHGMKDSGGHGGVTKPEIILPLVSIGKGCIHVPGWPVDYITEQTDLAPTIATAFGLPMPVNNIGKIIPSVLRGMDLKDIFEALELNKLQLTLQSRLPEYDVTPNVTGLDLLPDSELRERGKTYFQELSDLSEGLKSVSDFNIIELVLSISVMWIILTMIGFVIFRDFSRPKRATHYFFIFGTMFHGISLSSTSMIEEEHQTWYFFWVTMWLLVILETLSRIDLRTKVKLKVILLAMTLLVGHRILRKLNQTGDKWAMLPDIKGFLNTPENHSALIVIYFSGLLALFWCAVREGCTKHQLVTFGGGLLMNLCYRLSVTSIQLDFLSFYPKSRGNWECTMFWTLTFMFIVLSAKNKKTTYLFWTLAGSILVKPHNVILIPMCVLANKHIDVLYSHPRDLLWNTIAHVWTGYVFYFYQGNGNSVANIDVSAGFTGLNEYNPVFSCIMIAAHTNFSIILSYLLSQKSDLVVAMLRIIPLTLYCTFLLFQLNHLFIWSVFSPKLLYEANFSIIFLTLMSCHAITDYVVYFF